MDNNDLIAMGTLGVIFTDTCVLADKYNCRRQEVIDVIETFIRYSVDRGVDWQLVDVGGHDFDYIFKYDVTWQGYCRALADNCAGMGWNTDCNTPLFIIGGDDVIPVPRILFSIPGDQQLIPLEVDMLYCYPPDFSLQNELERFVARESYKKGELYEYFMANASFNVSRLPIEKGSMPTSLQQDLYNYLRRCNEIGGIITVDNILPTTSFAWYFSTQKTVENMPLLPLGPNNGCHMGDIFVSPLLRMSDGASMAEYTSALNKSDLLMFNLHGSHEPEATGFYGQGDVFADTQGHLEYPTAFDIELLHQCKAKILNTEACFGARYVDYHRGNSMLLASLYGSNVLLYLGACSSSFYDQPIFGPNTNVNNLQLASYADSLMIHYLNYQMQGCPAGLAMLKAKWQYYDECCPNVKWLSDYTIYEFNQFGDPSLCVRATRYNRIHTQQYAKSTTRYFTERVVAKEEKFIPVYSKTSIPELDAAYSDVRESVDIALKSLSDELRKMLSDDYHYPSQHLILSTVLREETIGGHLFVYAHDSQSDSEHRIYVRVDGAGIVKRITHKM